MRGERIKPGPAPHITGVAVEGRGDPAEHLGYALPRLRRIEAAPGHILHQAMHREALTLDVNCRQRDGG